ncbi:MAG TPA: glycosyltransferase [Steroidobacteraceae bacterium]|nr:glycosyltransferase [Steroidobacteraceae bacterium]
MPKVSIIMPTYNRADTIERAIRSAQAQTFEDWELVIIDDGSIDNTAALIPKDDPRIRYHAQPNRGFVAARNAGLQAAVGEYVAFLDSDDELKPFHLQLGVSYLDAFPGEHFVTSEAQEDFGHDRFVYHYRIEFSQWYPRAAAAIGSSALDLPAGETDDYMRAWPIREPVGPWGSAILDRAGIPGPSYIYRGRIFPHLRWGFVMCVNSLIVRRQTLKEVGFLDPRYGLAADQELICRLSLRDSANFIGVPTYIKHEYTPAGKIPAVSHLGTGKTAVRFFRDLLIFYDDYFMNPQPDDAELKALRCLILLDTAHVALRLGLRDEALDFLRQARAAKPNFSKAITMTWITRCVRSPQLAEKLWRRAHQVVDAVAGVFRARPAIKRDARGA